MSERKQQAQIQEGIMTHWKKLVKQRVKSIEVIDLMPFGMLFSSLKIEFYNEKEV